MAAETDGLSTIPVDILAKVPERMAAKPLKYKPSYVLRIINRSIPKEDATASLGSDIRRGHYSAADPGEHHIINKNPEMGITLDGYSINYRGLTLVGLNFGESILAVLDKKFAGLNFGHMTEKQVFRTASFASIVAGATHPFKDANGRSAVGLADVILRWKLAKRLNFGKLMEENHKLTSILSAGSLALLPDQYNPNAVVIAMRDAREKERSVQIPNKLVGPPEAVTRFLSDYSQSITRFIEGFDPEKAAADSFRRGSLDVRWCVDDLADLYRRTSVPLSGPSSPVEGLTRKLSDMLAPLFGKQK